MEEESADVAAARAAVSCKRAIGVGAVLAMVAAAVQLVGGEYWPAGEPTPVESVVMPATSAGGASMH